MGARALLSRRAVLERNAATGTNPYGSPNIPSWEAHAVLPCYVWSRIEQQIVNQGSPGTPTLMRVEDLRALFMKDADVHEGDRVAHVTDRLGNIIWPGPILIESIVPRPDHLEAQLRRLG